MRNKYQKLTKTSPDALGEFRDNSRQSLQKNSRRIDLEIGTEGG